MRGGRQKGPSSGPSLGPFKGRSPRESTESVHTHTHSSVLSEIWDYERKYDIW